MRMSKVKVLSTVLVLCAILLTGLTVGIVLGMTSSIRRVKERIAVQDQQIVLLQEQLVHTETALRMELETNRRLEERMKKQ